MPDFEDNNNSGCGDCVLGDQVYQNVLQQLAILSSRISILELKLANYEIPKLADAVGKNH